MHHTNPEKSILKNLQIRNYPGKIGRTDRKTWVKVCPACFSPQIQPLTNISGTIVQEQWVCLECNYAGVAIEVNAEDLTRFRLQQIAAKYNINSKKLSH
ncbi:MAG: hypothetical protein ACFFD8_05410 [Candidatus Thorarchaeota archaeon]